MTERTTRSLREIGDELHACWRMRLDRRASTPFAHEACIVVQGRVDPLRDHEGVVAAAEFLWDTEDHLFNARKLVTAWRRRVGEATGDWTAEEALAPRVKALLLHARLAFRGNEYALARVWADAAVRLIRREAGGDQALRTLAERGERSPFVNLYTSFLAIQIPVLRLARGDSPHARQLLDMHIADALKIIETCPPYDRFHQLVRQTLFAVADRRDSMDAARLAMLAEEDMLSRPDTARARCTRHLVEMALAGFRGDATAELDAAIAAERDLRSAGLERQIRALNARGWWKLRPAA